MRVVSMASKAIIVSVVDLVGIFSHQGSQRSFLVSKWSTPSFRYLWPTVLLRKTGGITDLYKHTRTNYIKDKGIKSSATTLVNPSVDHSLYARQHKRLSTDLTIS